MTERNVLVVDWSANSKPKIGADSIWIGDAYGNRVNPSTRVEAIEFLKKLILQKGHEQKWLIAFDFSFGVPWWDGRTDGGGLKFWEEVLEKFPEDSTSNFDYNNKGAELRWELAHTLNQKFFKGKNRFWGCPEKRQPDFLCLSSKKGDRQDDQERANEKRTTDTKSAKSPWQLLGVGSVGSQMLMGICHLQRWRKDEEWSDKISVWPFENSRKQIVFAETFPSHEIFKGLIDRLNNHRCGLVKDALQVTSVAYYLKHALPDLDAVSKSKAIVDRCLKVALTDPDAKKLNKGSEKVESEGLILTPDRTSVKRLEKEFVDRPDWGHAQLDGLFLGPDQGPCEWIGDLNKVSEEIQKEVSDENENPSEPRPTKRTTPD